MTDLVQKLLTAVKDWDYAWESTGDGPDLETVIRQALADAGGAVAYIDEAGTLYPCAESIKNYLPKGRTATPLHTHPAPTDSDRVAELEAQLAESRERVARAYGLLWHVNAGIDAPWGTPSLTPERAAMESRKVLRDMLTSEQRGDGINAARDLMKALAADKEKNDE